MFVVAITELSGQLVRDHSLDGFLRFAGLFVPVFVAWQGYSFYADRFDTDDLIMRLGFFAGMLAIAAMAVLIGDVMHGAHTAGFVIAYVVLRSIMLLLYLRAWIDIPDARPLTRFYGLGYSLGVLIWISSLAFAPPARYWVWGIALAVELSLPPLSRNIHRRVPTSSAHVPERLALFTLIVLGESIVAVALETAGSDWQVVSATAAVLGFIAVVAVWWLYFDRQANVVLQGGTPKVVVYSYAHLPLLMGLAAMSAGVRLVIEHASDVHLGLGASTALLGGVAVFIAALVITRSVTVSGPKGFGAGLKLGAGACILALLALQSLLAPVVVVGALAFVLVALVVAVGVLVPPDRSASPIGPGKLK